MSQPASPPLLSRRALFGGAAAAAAAFAAGCSPVNPSGGSTGKDAAHKGAVSLSFWKPPGLDTNPENKFYNALTKSFASSHGGDQINHLVVPWDNALTKYTAAFGGGTPPDISYQILLWLDQFSSSGVLAPLTEIDPKLDLSGYETGALNSAKGSDGKLYGLPYYSSRFVLALNLDAYEAAGSPTLPKTYADLTAFVKMLTVDNNGNRPGDAGFDRKNIKTYGMSWPGDYATQTNYIWNYLWSYGADFLSQDNKDIGFDNAGGRTALGLIRQMQLDGSATPINLYADPDKFGELLPTGKAAVAWIAPPTPATWQQFPKARLKVLDLPSGPKGTFIIGGLGYLSVATKSKYPQTALEFIKFIGNDANVSKYLQETLLFPVKSTITASVYDAVANRNAREFLAAALPQGKFLRTTRPEPYSPDQFLIGEVNNYVSGQKSLDQMISDAHKEIKVMAKNAGI